MKSTCPSNEFCFHDDHQDASGDSVVGMPEFFSLRLYCGPSGRRLTRCMSETPNWSVDNETGILESMGTGAEISGLNSGRGDPPGAAPKMFGIGGDLESGGQ